MIRLYCCPVNFRNPLPLHCLLVDEQLQWLPKEVSLAAPQRAGSRGTGQQNRQGQRVRQAGNKGQDMGLETETHRQGK